MTMVPRAALLLGGALDRAVGVVALALRGVAQHVVRALNGGEDGRVAALVGVLLRVFGARVTSGGESAERFFFQARFLSHRDLAM